MPHKIVCFILALFAGSVWATAGFAETILLKSGQTVEVKILERRDDAVTVEFAGVPVTFYHDEISSISSDTDLSDTPVLPDPQESLSTTPASVDPIVEEGSGPDQCVVVIDVVDKDQKLQLATGFFVSDDGLVATNFHPFFNAVSAQVKLKNGQVVPVEAITNYNADLDVAVLKVAVDRHEACRLGDSDSLSQGERVHSIGHPGGNYYQVHHGSFLEHKEVYGQPAVVFQIPSEQGGSGSPVFNQNDEVVAVAALGSLDDPGLNYSIPINAARKYFNYEKFATFAEFQQGLHPSFIAAYTGQGLQKQRRYDEAIVKFKEATALDPKSLSAYIGLAESYEALGKAQDAATYWMEVLKIDTSHAHGNEYLGNLYLDRGMYADAVKHLETAVHGGVQNKYIFNNLGIAYSKNGALEKAIEMYTLAVAQDPDYGEGYFNLAVVYYNLRDLKRAKEYAQRALDLQFSVPESFKMALGL